MQHRSIHHMPSQIKRRITRNPARAAPSIVLTLVLLLAAPCAVMAQSSSTAQAAPTTPAALPAWDQLTPTQRELLIAPMRERWNANPESRARMYGHAREWSTMTPDQRQRAHHGMRRWEHMDPKKRDEMRALFHKMRGMTPEQRSVLRNQWHDMSDAQRQDWVKANTPAQD